MDRKKGDVKLTCEGKDVFCHKFLLISGSPVFRAMFDMDSKENRENVVAIEDCNQETLEAFVTYLYDARMSKNYSPEDLELVFGLLYMANKYQVHELLLGCMDTLLNIMNTDNVLKILAVVVKLELGDEIKDQLTNFMKENIVLVADSEEWAPFLSDYPSLMKDFVIKFVKGK